MATDDEVTAVADAMRERMNAIGSYAGDIWPIMARVALEAAEKAHTPTDDEREALTYLITAFRFRERGLRGTAMEPDLAVSRPLAEFLLAEGFRRTEVPEPSANHAYRGNRSQDTCWVEVDGEMCRKPVEAHTPSDDVRVRNYHGDRYVRLYYEALKRIEHLEERLVVAEVPEPSAEDETNAMIDSDLANGVLASRREPQGEPSNVGESVVSDIPAEQMSAQGEPSDARVKAAAEAMSAYERDLDRRRGDESQRIWGHRGAFVAELHPTQEGRARAALRAAAQA